jgi:branched-chain amino acid aminotransferase
MTTVASTAETTPAQRARSSWVVHQGRIVRSDEVGLPLTTQGLHYGTGAFEGLRARPDGDELLLFRPVDHFARLLRSCRLLRIDLGLSAPELTQLTVDLLTRIGSPGQLYVRPIAHKLALLPGTRPGVGLDGVSDSLSIITFPLGSYAPDTGLRCAVSSWARPPANVIPTQAKIAGLYVNSALAAQEARSAGYDDAIMLNTRGEVAEATTANVFAVRGGRLFTPPDDADLLPGITRDTISTLAADHLGLPTHRQPLGVTDLICADEVFLTGTGLGVVGVTEVSGRPIADGVPGALTSTLARLYADATLGRLSQHRDWVTRIPLVTTARHDPVNS